MDQSSNAIAKAANEQKKLQEDLERFRSSAPSSSFMSQLKANFVRRLITFSGSSKEKMYAVNPLVIILTNVVII